MNMYRKNQVFFNPIPDLWGPMDPRHSKIVAVEKSLHESLIFLYSLEILLAIYLQKSMSQIQLW